MNTLLSTDNILVLFLLSLYDFLHSFIHLSLHSFIHSLIHSFTHSLIHSLTRSSIHLFTHPFISSLIHSPLHSSIHLFTHSFTSSLIHSFLHPSIHSSSNKNTLNHLNRWYIQWNIFDAVSSDAMHPQHVMQRATILHETSTRNLLAYNTKQYLIIQKKEIQLDIIQNNTNE